MNLALWVLQILLALFFIAGGAYKVLKVDQMPGYLRAIPVGVWRLLGIIELAGGVLLVVPAFTSVAAAVLTLESIALAVFYGRQSLKLSAANPFTYVAVMAPLAAIIAWGRM